MCKVRLYTEFSIFLVPVFLPAGSVLCVWPAGPKITLGFSHLYIYICASALIMCAIITSGTLLLCDIIYT